ncbi:hypothetical protein [Aggregatibacter kilianii]|uniref:hypothetical protein n=1 Tax=Aggregatibacter kilianii TaxID=2025884 RepID=UPI000D658A15|nr:hypothetical protein [Aggregatibacter kilianii]
MKNLIPIYTARDKFHIFYDVENRQFCKKYTGISKDIKPNVILSILIANSATYILGKHVEHRYFSYITFILMSIIVFKIIIYKMEREMSNINSIYIEEIDFKEKFLEPSKISSRKTNLILFIFSLLFLIFSFSFFENGENRFLFLISATQIIISLILYTKPYKRYLILKNISEK